MTRIGEHVPHHLHQTLTAGHIRHPFGVLAREREEQGVLVAEVMEDRAPRHADGVFETAHRGAVIAVLGKTAPRAIEDLAATSREVILANARHCVGP
ncbi:Uncharacterised protein [Mycobacteroides abscessus subsp. massiliense]|nr:Uncharacterised protein [Mycobacteroides abscessus subsp. massiliense]